MNRQVKTHSAKNALNETGTGVVDTQGAPAVVMYVQFGPGTTAGAVKLQGGPKPGPGGVQASDADWADISLPIVWAAASTTKYLHIAEGHRFVRAKISTAIAGGTVDVYVSTSGYPAGVEEA